VTPAAETPTNSSAVYVDALTLSKVRGYTTENSAVSFNGIMFIRHGNDFFEADTGKKLIEGTAPKPVAAAPASAPATAPRVTPLATVGTGIIQNNALVPSVTAASLKQGTAKSGSSASTLFEWYQAQGQALPSVTTRAKLYQSLGLGQASFYTGTAEQNTKLLNALKAQ
jgi:hypothetical protein